MPFATIDAHGRAVAAMKELAHPVSPAAASAEAVRVVVQARPLLPFEQAEGASSVLALSSEPPIVSLDSSHGPPSIFDGFDDVYDAAADIEAGACSSEKLYADHVDPLVQCVFDGVNATAFAYGQTCAGKSFTMDRLVRGVADGVFARRDAVAQERSALVTVRVGFIEIYNERIRDLVDGTNTPLGASSINIQVRERRGKGGGVFLDGAKERVVEDAAALQRIVAEGSVLRQTAATGMNSSSSRSHSVITLSIQVEPIGDNAARSASTSRTPTLSAKLHLVDLAGSERAKRTAAKGDRFKEGVQINTSLFALAKVISALADNARARRGVSKKHVPYRDSKLTRLLQDSLGGTARTLLIACVSPASTSREETIGTLRYAARAKAIKNKLKVNVDVHAVEVADLRAALARARAQVSALAAENQALRERVGPPSGGARRPRPSLPLEELHQPTAQEVIIDRDSLVASRSPRHPLSPTCTNIGLAAAADMNDQSPRRITRDPPNPPRARRRARVAAPSNSISAARAAMRRVESDAAPQSRLRRRRHRPPSANDEEESVHTSDVQRALNVVRTDEMRRHFEQRTLRLEREKATLQASKSDLQRQLSESRAAHTSATDELKTWRVAARSGADSARMRRERNDAVRARRAIEVKLADARGVRNELLRKVAIAMARVDAVRKELGRDNRTLAKNMAHLKAQLERSLVLRARQDAAIDRLTAENDVLKRKLVEGTHTHSSTGGGARAGRGRAIS